MLQGEIFIKRLATELSVEVEQSLDLWQRFVALLTQRLIDGRDVDMQSFGVWSLRVAPEFVAETEDGRYLIPPQIKLSISETVGQLSICSFAELASNLEPYSQMSGESILRFLLTIPTLSLALLRAGHQVSWQGLGVCQLEGEVLSFSPDVDFVKKLNKPFEGFTPEVINEAETFLDLECRSLTWEEVQNTVLSPLSIRLIIAPSSDADNSVEVEERQTKDRICDADDEIIFPSKFELEATTKSGLSELPNSLEANPVSEVEEPSRAEGKTKNKRGLLPIFLLIFLGVLVFLLYYLYRTGAFQFRTEQSETYIETVFGLATNLSHSDTLSCSQVLGNSHCDKTVERDSLTPTEAEALTQAESKTPNQAPKKEQGRQTQITNKGLAKSQITARDYAEDIELSSGESLASLSLRKYGHKAFWVYIYEENRERIQDPHNIPVGTKLHLPTAEKYGIDPHNTKSLKQALLLSRSL